MRAAYDALDAETKAEIEDLVCEHSLMYSRGALGFTDSREEEQRCSGRCASAWCAPIRSLAANRSILSSHAGAIVGWPMPEARAFLRDLTEHATQPQFVYVHKWRQHDLVMWDNRQTMHRVRRFDETQLRDMRRTTVAGDALTWRSRPRSRRASLLPRPARAGRGLGCCARRSPKGEAG